MLDHLPLVKAIAIRVHENLPVHVDLDDLVHAGVLGLFDAAKKFDPAKKVVFQGYAKHRIKGAILDSLRQLDWASRDLRKRQKQLDAVTRALMKLGRTPTETKWRRKWASSIERWRQRADGTRISGLISAHALRSNTRKRPEFPATRIRNRTACASASSCRPRWHAP